MTMALTMRLRTSSQQAACFYRRAITNVTVGSCSFFRGSTVGIANYNKAFRPPVVPTISHDEIIGRCKFSSSPNNDVYADKATNRNITGKTKDNHFVIYLRNPRHNRIPRANIAFCCLHTTYWGWYLERCASTFVLGTGGDTFFVYPQAGLYGFFVAMMLNYACYTYSKLLVSKITFYEKSGKVRVWFHKLPFLTQTEKAVTFDIGEVFLDREKAEVVYLLGKLGGDVTRFQGHLPLRVQSDHYESRWPLLAYCKDGFEVKDSYMFLQALLFDVVSRDGEDTGGGDQQEDYYSKERQNVGKMKRNKHRIGRKRRPGR